MGVVRHTPVAILALVGQFVGGEAPLRFARYGVSEGLSESSAETLLQDRHGFVWVGTNDGLNRFDGYSFRIYRSDPDDPASLSDDNIGDLLEDREGRLWVATEDGLNLYDSARDTFQHFHHDPTDDNTLSNGHIESLLEAEDGALWVGTYYGLNRLDPSSGRITRYYHNPEDPGTLPSNQVLGMAEDGEGRIWVGTRGGGLAHLDPATGRFQRYAHDPEDPGSLSHDEPEELLVDGRGRLWVGTNGGGLDLLDPSTGSFLHFRHDAADPTSLGNDRVHALLEDDAGVLWVGTDGGGLNRRTPDGWLRYVHDPNEDGSLASNSVRSLIKDRNGDLWVGCYAGGFHFLDRHDTGFRHHGQNPDGTGLSDSSVLAFHEDPDGTLWVGTEGGLDRIDGGSGEILRYAHDPGAPRSLGANAVLAIERDSQGRLWVGTFFGGLNLLDEESGTFTHFQPRAQEPRSLSSPHVWSVLGDSRGQLWVGTFAGLNRLDPGGGFTHYRWDLNDSTTIAHDVLWTLYEDRAGRLWVGSQGGLSLFQPSTDSFRSYPGLTGLNVYAIHQDRAGALWVGTDGGGLQRVDPDGDVVESFGTADGMPSAVVTGILEDDEGRLWLATNHGISRFDPQNRTFRNYDRSSGLQGNQFNRGAFLRSRTGELLFGGIHGYNSFLPQDVRDNPRVPPIVITDFRIFNVPVVPGPEAPLDVNIEDASRIQLSYDQSIISFEFAALGYRNPAGNRYRYMLEGLDADWVEAGARRTTTYTNLDADHYVFRVIGSNDSGLWNTEGASIELVVHPPFWGTWWFRLAAILAVGASLFGGYRFRTRYILARNLALEREVAERRRAEERLAASNRELAARHTELERFTHAISHELRTPLVTIHGFLGLLQKDLESGDAERGNGDIRRISHATQRMAALLDQLLALSEIGHRSSPPETIDLNELAREAVELVGRPISMRGVDVTIAADLPAVQGDRMALREVLRHLVENAVKFMGDQKEPSIEIGAIDRDQETRCYVRDNGMGVPPLYRERVFGLFERLSGSGEGTGSGLALVRRIIQEHDGTTWLESEGLGRGSTFYFTLPKPRASQTAHRPQLREDPAVP